MPPARLIVLLLLFLGLAFLSIWLYLENVGPPPSVRPTYSYETTSSPVIDEDGGAGRSNLAVPQTTLEGPLSPGMFRFVLPEELPAGLPSSLEVYQFHFPTSEDAANDSVTNEEAEALAHALGIQGQVHWIDDPNRLFLGAYSSQPRWFAGDVYLPSVPEQRPSTSTFLEIQAWTGRFYYSSGGQCETKSRVSPKEAEQIAWRFLLDRNLIDRSETTSTVFENKTFPASDCYVVYFTNTLPTDNRAPKNLYSYINLDISIPDAYNTRGFPDEGYAVAIDPQSGQVVSIYSDYLKLVLAGSSGTKSLRDIRDDLRIGRGEIIFSTFERFQLPAGQGLIDARVLWIYPYYVDVLPSATERIGGFLYPYYYILAEVELPDLRLSQEYPIPTGALLIRVPALLLDPPSFP